MINKSTHPANKGKVKAQITSNIFVQWGYIISWTALTLLLSQGSPPYILILGIISSFFISVYFIFKKNILYYIFDGLNRNGIIISLIVTLIAGGNFSSIFHYRFGNTMIKFFRYMDIFRNNEVFMSVFCTIIVTLVSLFSLFSFYYYLTGITIPYIYKISRDKKTLFIYCTWAVCIIILFVYIMTITNAFTYPVTLNNEKINNVIFGSDGDFFTGERSYLIFSDSFQHPFFSIVFMPIIGVCLNLSTIIGMIANLDSWIIFSIIYCILQITSMVFIALIIHALLLKSVHKQVAFWGGLLYLTTFPSLLFSILIERYALEVLLLVFFFYICIEGSDLRHKMTFFIVSIGSVISSCAAYPVIAIKEQARQVFSIKNIFKAIALFVLVMIVSGRMTSLYSFSSEANYNLKFTNNKKSVFDTSVMQYLSFESGIYFAPNWQSTRTIGDPSPQENEISFQSVRQEFLKEFPEHPEEFPEYGIAQAYPSNKIYHFIGFGIMSISFAGFIFSRKDKLAQISFWWFFIGILVLAIVGLGTTFNEMCLYLCYFAWPQIILTVLCINKFIKSIRLKTIVLGTFSGILFIANIYSIISMATSLQLGFPPLF